jgi:phosphate acetyltransferase
MARRHLSVVAEVSYRPELTWPRIRDLVRHLHPQILHEGDMSRRIRDVAVFAGGIPVGLRVLDTGRLVVVPGDRHDVIMAAYLTELSGTHLAGLLLSAGIAPIPGSASSPGPPRPPAYRSCSWGTIVTTPLRGCVI